MPFNNKAIFDNILLRFDNNKPELHQIMATTCREYWAKQFSDQGGDFGTWPAKVDGTTPTLYKTGNLFDKLIECDRPGNYDITGSGEDTTINLKVNALSDEGFDYGEFHQDEKHRIIMAISYQLNELLQESMKQELNKLKDETGL